MIRLARHALAYPRAWILGVLALTLLAGAGMLRLELHTEGSVIHPRDDALIRQSEFDRLRFQDPRQVIVLVGARSDGPRVESAEGFRFLKRLQLGLRRLPAVRADSIMSIAAMPRLVDGMAGFSVGTHLDDIPDDPVAFAALVETLREHPLTNGLLLSRDGRLAAFYVPLTEGRPIAQGIGELERFVAEQSASGFTLRLTGPQVAEATLGRMVLHDLALLIPLMVVLIALLLFLTLGTVGGVLIPLAEAAVVLIWVLGAMGWLGVPVTLVTTILPVVLMAMAITDEIHLLEWVQHTAGDSAMRPRVEAALAQVGRPIIVTSVTTSLGFLSFLSASVMPLRQFGLFTAAGIGLAMVLSFCFIPALLVVLPPNWFRRRRPGADPAPRGASLGHWAARHAGAAVGIGLLAVALAAPGLAKLRVQDSWIENFPADTPLVTADSDLNASFWGSYRFDVVFEAERAFFHSPGGAAALEDFERVAARAPHVGGVLTYLIPLGDVARSLAEPLPLSALSAARVGDLTTVVEMSSDRLALRQLLTAGGESARARVFVNGPNYARAAELRGFFEQELPALAAAHGVSYHFSGDLPVATAVVDAIVGNQLRSIGWALLAVALALLVFARRLESLVALVPVAAAAVILFGVMGYSNMPLGIATSMFTSLTIGVGVDFGIHYWYRYRAERQACRTHSAALEATLARTGRALRWNMIVLALGFLLLSFSSLKPNYNLGLLLGSAMLTCYLATLLFLPRLLRATAPATLIVLAFAAAPGASAASTCPAKPDPAAQELMAGLEADFRAEARIVRMQIATGYHRRHPLWPYFQENTDDKTLWGVFNGDAAATRLLYVFSGPGRLAGTALLMHDQADPQAPDANWLYLRSFDHLTPLGPSSQKLLVPGTALSYEDSRGFIPLDKYTFSFVARADAIPGAGTAVLACPRSETIAENVGYSALLLTIDRSRRLVRSVDYSDLGGKPLKRYELVGETKLAERWVPKEVRLDHHADAYTTTISYEHWLPPEAPPAALFVADVAQGSFIARLQPWLARAGLADRIDPEIAAADAEVKASDDARRRPGEDGNSTAPSTPPRRPD